MVPIANAIAKAMMVPIVNEWTLYLDIGVAINALTIYRDVRVNELKHAI